MKTGFWDLKMHLIMSTLSLNSDEHYTWWCRPILMNLGTFLNLQIQKNNRGDAMEFLPRSTILGDLSVIEIYEYYDIPSLFSCKNSTGHIYLALSVDEDDASLTWMR